MSRSTASPPPERGVPSEGRPPRERSDDHERQAMRPRRVSASFAGGGLAAAVEHNVHDTLLGAVHAPTLKFFGGALRC